ncbi:hypothetical protein [Geothrix fermentans]|jgi:hypothetical protein|uniref:hypothetical protein n=1 Tax=Geothrix fermentans TaxID=44676 RepID=UPI0012FC701D|nr:hypothetical protein [Geothrix fermentans]
MNLNISRNIVTITLVALLPVGCNRSTKKDPPSKVASASAQNAKPTVHIEKNSQNGITIQDLNEEESFSGAGTAFSLASAPESSNGIIFGYSSDDDATGVRVNDHLYKLKQIGTKVIKKGKGEQGLGERCTEIWSGDGIVVEFDYTTTSAGEGGSGYKGQVNITLGSQKATFEIIGGSGC